jgi:hypothetical protein
MMDCIILDTHTEDKIDRAWIDQKKKEEFKWKSTLSQL